MRHETTYAHKFFFDRIDRIAFGGRMDRMGALKTHFILELRSKGLCSLLPGPEELLKLKNAFLLILPPKAILSILSKKILRKSMFIEPRP